MKNLVRNFGAIYVGNMHAKFQPFSFTGRGGGGGDRRKEGRQAFLPQTNKPTKAITIIGQRGHRHLTENED